MAKIGKQPIHKKKASEMDRLTAQISAMCRDPDSVCDHCATRIKGKEYRFHNKQKRKELVHCYDCFLTNMQPDLDPTECRNCKKKIDGALRGLCLTCFNGTACGHPRKLPLRRR